MALLWIEGFEGFGDTAGAQIQTYLYRKYPHITAGSTIWYIQTGRTGGFACRGNQSGGQIITPPLTTADTVIVGCAIKPTSSTSNTFIYLYDGTTLGINFKFDTATGEISVYRGSSTLLGTTTGAGVVVDGWSFVEMKVKCHQSAGTVEVKVGSVVRLSLENQDTQAGSNACHDTLGIGTTSAGYIDDVYFCDNTGPVNNDWIGVRKIVGLFPNEDSTTVQWTPSTGETHYSLVNEAFEGGAYVHSGTVGDTDLWGYQDATEIGAIQGIQINTCCRETAAQSFDLITPIEIEGEVYEDAGISVGTTTTGTLSRVVETNPDTGGPWTIEELNASKIGVKLG